MRETTLQDVLAATGPLFKVTDHGWNARKGARYVVFGVSGHGIRPAEARRTHGRGPTTTWCVLDSVNQWLEVARYTPGGGMSGATAHRKATAVCAMLNRADGGYGAR